MSEPRRFPSAAAFREWLRQNHATAREMIVRLQRVHAADRGMTYAQALDEALCYGWIDGIRRAVDGDSFSVRFTPRKPRSTWSTVNVRHAERLIAERRMRAPGLAAFRAHDAKRTGIYSFERPAARLPPRYSLALRADAAAWTWFQSQPPWYRRTSAHWIMSAKQETTRSRRFSILLACSARGEPVPPLKRPR